MKSWLAALSCLFARGFISGLGAVEYPYETAEPQKTGWPLSAAAREFVLRPEHERRPGFEKKQPVPHVWPSTPSAGNWGGTGWLDTHARLVAEVRAVRGPVDILLVGDSITQQWGGQLGQPFNAAWKRHFAACRTVNIGIAGDKTENILWRLDHGGVDGLAPRVVVLLAGNNNMFHTAETGTAAVAAGLRTCVQSLRAKLPQAAIIVVKTFPCHAPGFAFYDDILKTNQAFDALQLDAEPGVEVLDLTDELLHPDGTLKRALFTPDSIHLSQDAGYSLFASRLHPLIKKHLAR